MVRTQIYLSEKQRAHVMRLAAQEGENFSGLIRKAVESYLAAYDGNADASARSGDRIFDKVFGMWHDNDTDFAGIRQSADRLK